MPALGLLTGLILGRNRHKLARDPWIHDLSKKESDRAFYSAVRGTEMLRTSSFTLRIMNPNLREFGTTVLSLTCD